MPTERTTESLQSEAHAIVDCLVYLHRHCVKLELTTTAYLIDAAQRSVNDSVKSIEKDRNAVRRSDGKLPPVALFGYGANDP
jgi:hypothetical protein